MPDKASLLGAPLTDGPSLNDARYTRWGRAIGRLSLLPAYDAFTLLKSFFSTPKIIHTLRCSPCFGNKALEEFGSLLRSGLCTITNLTVSDPQWIQASLPVSAWGLGIRRVVSLALPAFLTSAASTHSLRHCGELIYWMFNSDPIYYANDLFVNIYAFIQSYIVWAVLFSLILCERCDVRAHRLFVINHYMGWDWLPGVGQTAASL